MTVLLLLLLVHLEIQEKPTNFRENSYEKSGIFFILMNHIYGRLKYNCEYAFYAFYMVDSNTFLNIIGPRKVRENCHHLVLKPWKNPTKFFWLHHRNAEFSFVLISIRKSIM